MNKELQISEDYFVIIKGKQIIDVYMIDGNGDKVFVDKLQKPNHIDATNKRLFLLLCIDPLIYGDNDMLVEYPINLDMAHYILNKNGFKSNLNKLTELVKLTNYKLYDVDVRNLIKRIKNEDLNPLEFIITDFMSKKSGDNLVMRNKNNY